MRSIFYQALFAIFIALALNAAVVNRVSAEEFRYYVWIDDEGIVHASQEAPKGRDYKVRIIEDINANVVPAEDFGFYDNPPVGQGIESADEAAASENVQSGQAGESAERNPQAAQ